MSAIDTDGQPAEELPLAGVRVLEFCHTVMGPTCGLMLADLGAEVIKVEPAPQGDRTRVLQGFVVGAFSYFNRNKKSIGLNLKSEEGREILHRLVADADVVAENYGPGTAERLGMGYEELAKVNPRLIYCALKGFLPGPYEHRAALDEVAQFMTGLAYMTGPPGQPLRAATSVIDMLGGIFGAMGIMGALRQRETTGRGCKVRSALFESSAFLVGQYMAGQAVTGVPPVPLPVRGRSWAIYETFDTRDGGKVFLGLTSNNHWKTFCDVFERPDLKADPRYDTNEKRLDAYDFIRPLVQSVVLNYTAEEIIDLLAPEGIPIGQVGQPGDLFEDEHLNAAGGLLATMMTTGERAKLPALPFTIAGERMGLRLDPPELGEHTHEVMARIGLSKAEVDALIEQEILR
ncbi:MAG: CoA transferase [Gammaproteobacteria bacterium]|nr:CoA transferase [Gammaproteobacteria bacterium]